MKKLSLILAVLMLLLAGCSTMNQTEPVSVSEQEESTEEPVTEEIIDEEPVDQIDPDDEWQLILVNAITPLAEEMDKDWVDIPSEYCADGYELRADERMLVHLEEMMDAAKEEGIELMCISGYRTFARSEAIFNNQYEQYLAQGYSEDEAYELTALRIAPPGTSEHHTGLAADLLSKNYWSLHADFCDEFEDDPEGIWLRENCAKYGFILRYPKDKEAYTGIDYEPWHFRYVGVKNAEKIMSEGLCLEEYLGAPSVK